MPIVILLAQNIDMKKELELLPCPFCGHAPKLKVGKVKCTNLQCKVQPKIAAWYAPGYDDKAAADWNTRIAAVQSIKT